MSASTIIAAKMDSNRNNKNNRTRKHRNGRGKGTQSEADNTKAQAQTEAPLEDKAIEQIEQSDVCWICAEPVKFYSVSECNHRTCHVCALRLRALYKRMDCTFCKHPQVALIFTRSSSDLFESYRPEMIPFRDNKLSIFFETQDMMEETLILLRFNCPDPSCDVTAHGWGDLKMHVRGVHGRSMCDMCIRHKKIFAHEHVLYHPSQLPLHLPSIPHRAQKNQERVEGGAHPMCEFCRECHFGDDELFAHMRERHEECFVCKGDGIRDKYFLDYNSLERHFGSAHFPCKDTHCQAQKFVVFGSALDLQAHMVEQHGEKMTARDRKDARRIEAGFDYDHSAVEVGGSRVQGRNRAREREPPEPGPPRSRRREGFGATLTSAPPDRSPVASSQPLHRQGQEDDQDSTSADIDPTVTERHVAFIARLNSLTSNSSSAVTAIKAAVRSYRASESGPRDLISTFFNVVNRDFDSAASLISALVELLDDEEKRRALLATWNGFKLEQQRQFPDLTPITPGSEYAGIAGGRVLNVKHSAAIRSSSHQSARQVWDRVAQAAASSSTSPSSPATRPQERFPTLASVRTSPAHRQPQHTTAWSATSSSRPATQSPGPPLGMTPSQGSTATTSRASPPKISHTLFPTLPSSGSSKAHSRPIVSGNQSLKHILGDTSIPSSSAWGSKKDEAAREHSGISVTENDWEPPPEMVNNKGKRKKGKEKQTLFTFGSFPT